MKLPLQITVRDMDMTESIEAAVREKAQKLETFHDHIMACRVVIESPHKHQHKGKMFNVRLDITVPGGELVVKREPHEDLYVSLRDAFDAARRQLKENAARRRGDVKTRAASPPPAEPAEPTEPGII